MRGANGKNPSLIALIRVLTRRAVSEKDPAVRNALLKRARNLLDIGRDEMNEKDTAKQSPLEGARKMAQRLVSIVMNPGFSQADLEDIP